MQTATQKQQQSIATVVGALRQGDLQAAELLCRNYLRDHPGSVPHLQLLARTLVHSGSIGAALEPLQMAIKLAPDFAPLYEDLGNIRGMSGDHNGAIEALKRAVQLDPQLSSAHKKLAQALQATGRHDEIDEAMEGYLDHDSEAAMVATGAEHWRAGRMAEAQTVLKKALRSNPDNVDAMRFLAMVYHAEGKYIDDAEALLRRAIAIAPDFHQALGNLGRILIENGKSEEAAEIYERWVELKPDNDEAWSGLGRARAHLGEVEAAATAYRESIRLNPDVASVHMALAHMLKTIGKQEEALAAYRESVRIKPSLGESYWSMANLKIFHFEPEEVDAMETQLAGGEVSEQGQVNFHFALGKAYEDERNYDKAWHHYHKGNQLQRTRVDYDPVENEMHLQKLRDVFTAERMAESRDWGHPDAAPIFIVGMPRSGSTLIEQILASHSQVEGTAELPNLAAIATGTGKYRHDGLVYPSTVNSFTPRDFAAYGKEYLQQVQRHRVEGAPFFIDKMPNNFIHVGWIAMTLPNAKIINTRRHPLDSCLGVYKQLFAKGQHFTYDTFELAEFYHTYVDIMDHWHEVLPGRVLDVHYEDTVTDLEQQVRKILDYCELPFEDNCLRYYETERAVKTASSEQVRQPIYTSALGLWQKYEKHLGEWQEVLGDVIDDLPPSVRAAAG
ncbi:tetratricopeptide repeat-containing sulfotransferase family protein [Pseudohalioglobus sediminis]|nr:tetratricopeptide repeat-containing sulfotransferase family protein [Pseudohalioglobus sediminis]